MGAFRQTLAPAGGGGAAPNESVHVLPLHDALPDVANVGAGAGAVTDAIADVVVAGFVVVCVAVAVEFGAADGLVDAAIVRGEASGAGVADGGTVALRMGVGFGLSGEWNAYHPE